MENINLFSFDFIFIGETHGFIKDFNKEREIIEILEPDFILAEQMQHLKLDSKVKKENILEKKKISEMVEFEELKDLIQICLKKDITLVGMDLRNFGFGKRLQQIIKNKIYATKKDIVNFEIIAKKRELLHLKKIKEYKKETKKPLLILLGTWHLRSNSPLMKKLRNYIVIYPCVENKKMLIEPPKHNQKVRYSYKIKNEENKI